MNDAGRILTALIVGLLTGVVARSVDSASAAVVARIVEPLGILWTNALRMAVIPMLVACIFGAVLQSPDLARFGRAAGFMAVGALVLLGASAALTLISGSALLATAPVDVSALRALREQYLATPAATAASLRTWFVDLVPVNPFKALAEGALLPIVIATLLFALATRRVALPERALVGQLAKGIADVSFVVIRWVLAAAPLGVFALMFSATVHAGQGLALTLVYYVLITAILCMLVATFLYLLVWISGSVPLARFGRAALAPQLVGFSSRSSLAALPLVIRASREQLRLPDEISDAFIPLLVSTFRVSGSIVLALGVVFVAWLYGVTLSAEQLVTAGLLSVVLSVALPAIPGGGVLSLAPLLTSVGLPADTIGLLLAVDAAADMFRTATNVTAYLALSTVVARLVGRR